MSQLFDKWYYNLRNRMKTLKSLKAATLCVAVAALLAATTIANAAELSAAEKSRLDTTGGATLGATAVAMIDPATTPAAQLEKAKDIAAYIAKTKNPRFTPAAVAAMANLLKNTQGAVAAITSAAIAATPNATTSTVKAIVYEVVKAVPNEAVNVAVGVAQVGVAQGRSEFATSAAEAAVYANPDSKATILVTLSNLLPDLKTQLMTAVEAGASAAAAAAQSNVTLPANPLNVSTSS